MIREAGLFPFLYMSSQFSLDGVFQPKVELDLKWSKVNFFGQVFKVYFSMSISILAFLHRSMGLVWLSYNFDGGHIWRLDCKINNACGREKIDFILWVLYFKV